MPTRAASGTTSTSVNHEVGDEAVKAKTGRDWKAWRQTLEADGCRTMEHKAIAKHVATKYKLDGWWSQMVTVGYERLVGLRQRHEKADGFAASASRTIATELGPLYQAWSDVRRRRKWLGAEAVTIRTATKNKSLRLNWSDETSRVNVHVYAKGPGKSLVTVEHCKLPDAKAVARMKAMWKERLGALKEMLEG